jgi:hypothetical protein
MFRLHRYLGNVSSHRHRRRHSFFDTLLEDFWSLFNGLLGVRLRGYGYAIEIAVQWPLTWLLVHVYTFCS